MGNVYLGTDILTSETVAIKQLRIELTGSMPEMVERFLREGEALRRLNHPNIVKVLATCDEGSQHYIVMEYVSGGSLADLLLQRPQLPAEQVVSLAWSCRMHSAAPITCTSFIGYQAGQYPPGRGRHPRLTDFGLARVGQLPRLTETGSILGTFYYLSPEAVENREVNERSDIWSFGIVLYEMLAGRLPFSGETPFEVVWAIKHQPLPPLENIRKGISPALSGLIGRMLRKDNPARVDSARQVGAEMEAIQKGLTSVPESILVSAPPIRPPKIRVLIVDDHAVVRQGLRMFIDLQEDMEVAAEGTNGAEAVDLAARLCPDIVLLDLVMPQMDGVEATSRIKAACSTARVIILTSFGEMIKSFRLSGPERRVIY